MPDVTIVYWRDIPAQVIVKRGRQNAKRELPLRFTTYEKPGLLKRIFGGK